NGAARCWGPGLLVTAPAPRRTSRKPVRARRSAALRTVVLETPSRTASSLSEGSRVPTGALLTHSSKASYACPTAVSVSGPRPAPSATGIRFLSSSGPTTMRDYPSIRTGRGRRPTVLPATVDRSGWSDAPLANAGSTPEVARGQAEEDAYPLSGRTVHVES